MKIVKYILLIVIAIGYFSCTKTDLITFHDDITRLHFTGDTVVYYTFVYEKSSVTRDTVYLTINTIGNIAKKDRIIKIEQVIKENQDNTAISGKHYVAFNNTEIKNSFCIKADSASATIPFILLRDASLDDASFRLKVRISENEDFSITNMPNVELERLIIFSNKLEKPKDWDNYFFGQYGKVKHHFMIEHNPGVVPIDEDFFSKYIKLDDEKDDYAKINYYIGVFKKALNKYNEAHPNNPLREKPEEGHAEGQLVTF
jgi:hypothetical protein